MAGKTSVPSTPESIARADRRRLAAEEGVRAMADMEQKAVAVRKNMERLRGLRRAKEAEKQAEKQAEQAELQVASPAGRRTSRKKGLPK